MKPEKYIHKKTGMEATAIYVSSNPEKKLYYNCLESSDSIPIRLPIELIEDTNDWEKIEEPKPEMEIKDEIWKIGIYIKNPTPEMRAVIRAFKEEKKIIKYTSEDEIRRLQGQCRNYEQYTYFLETDNTKNGSFNKKIIIIPLKDDSNKNQTD